MMNDLSPTSRLQGLLSNNRCPTNEERGYAKYVIDDFDQKLHGVRENISQLKSQLQLLYDQETALLDSISKYNNILSPIRRLPADVVQEIFMACLETDRNPTMSNKEAPVLLTHISSGLRQIALSITPLWAAIHIPITSNVRPELKAEWESRMTKRADAVKDWLLRRSGSSPLSISVHTVRSYSYDKTYIKRVLDMVISCCSRWRNVHFSCDLECLSNVATLTESDVPLLQSLSFNDTLQSFQPTYSWDKSGILRARHLKSLIMSTDGAIANYPVKWFNLTHLTYRVSEQRAGHTLGQLLRETSSLVSCDITLRLQRSAGVPSFGIISLPSLKILTVNEAVEMESDQGLLSAIRAPALEALSYNMDIDFSDIFEGNVGYESLSKPDSIISLLTQSPNVKELSLGFEIDEVETITGICRQCPLLNILYARHISFTSDDIFLKSFVLDDLAECSCPQLQYFRCDSEISVTMETLRKFIMRKDGNSPGLSRWKNVMMDLGYCHDFDASNQFEALTRQTVEIGLKLQVTRPKFYQASYSLLDGIPDRSDAAWAPSKFRK